MNSARKPDLHSLARAADTETSSRAVRRSAHGRMHGPAGRPAALMALVMVVALGGMLVIGGGGRFVMDQLVPGRIEARTQADFETVLRQARAAVEAHRQSEGSLPAVLPRGSLAALVRYERLANGYQLSISGSTITVRLDSDGRGEVIRHQP